MRRWISPVTVLAVLVGLPVAPTFANLLADAISVSGDSISRGFDANTGSCNYGDNVSRNWATGDNHGTSYCSAGSGGVFSHAERLECNRGGDVSVFNHAVSGGDMLHDFASQAAAMRTSLSAAPGPRYALVLMGHNDACTNILDKTGNSCGGDHDPNNYCRTTTAAFEREFRRGMDDLIAIPSSRIAVLATVRASELCNFRSKNGCGPTLGLNCSVIWETGGLLVDVFGGGGICASLTSNCSDQRRVDMYETLVAYNEILSRVTAEYAAIPEGGSSVTGGVKAADVHVRYGDGTFYYKLFSGDVSCCDCFHPSDQGHVKLAEFTWNGLQCSTTDPCCADTGDPLADARCDVADTTTFYPGGFWPNNIACPNGIVDPGEQCDDGNANDGDCCSSICTFEPGGVACTADGNACTADVCDGSGACTHPPATGASCASDGNVCTADVCGAAGTCTHSAIPGALCASDGNVCTTDVCDGSGACTHPPASGPCDDGNACTRTDACAGGTCVGGNPLVCTAADRCHAAGVCNPTTGVCSDPSAPDGTACDDANACTQSDACAAGTCVGADPVTCEAPDQCHSPGTCAPLTGVCSSATALPNGSGCDDGDGCTQIDTCQSGSCVGGSPVTCTAPDQCHDVGICNPLSGACAYPVRADGAACDDGNPCTLTDTCQDGACVGADPVMCGPLDQCHDGGVCSPADGVCSNPDKANDAPCDDGNACTFADRCVSGACVGTSAACGDGVVETECAETCDHGTENGLDDCCSVGCQVIDGDGDGECDRDDPCTGTTPVTRAKLVIKRLDTPPGDDSLLMKGEVALPFPFEPPLNPSASGLRFVVTDETALVLDVHVPGGAEWRSNSSGTRWSYTSHADDRPGAITRVLVRQLRRLPGTLKIVVKGRDGDYPASVDALPLAATVVFDPPAATSGQCGIAEFPGPRPAARCSADAAGSRIVCR